MNDELALAGAGLVVASGHQHRFAAALVLALAEESNGSVRVRSEQTQATLVQRPTPLDFFVSHR
jgi:hypothetical protein